MCDCNAKELIKPQTCVVAGLRYYFRIYKYEYLGELMTSELHILLSIAMSRDFTRSRQFLPLTFQGSILNLCHVG